MLESRDALPNGRATAPKTGPAGKPVLLLFLEVFKSCIIKLKRTNHLTDFDTDVRTGWKACPTGRRETRRVDGNQ